MADQFARHLVVSRPTPRIFQTRGWMLNGLIVALTLIFVLKASTYGLLGNLQILAISMATIGIVAVGQTLVVITGGVDLSVGSLVALTGIVAAKITYFDLGPLGSLQPWLAALFALLVAACIGWANGWLITRFRLTPFIVTFGSLSFVLGIAKVLSGGSPVNLKSDALDWIWLNVFGIIPVPAIIMLLIFEAMAFWLRNSRYGRHAYATGSNESAARLSGVQVDSVRRLAYALSGVLAGMAGLLVMVQIKGGTFGNGQGYELLSIAAVIIGGTSLNGGRGSIWGTLAGVLLISIIKIGLGLFDVPWLWNDMAVGTFIVIAALIDMERRRATQVSPLSILTSSIAAPNAKESSYHPVHSLEQALERVNETVTHYIGAAEIQVLLYDRAADAWTDIRKPDQALAQVSTSARSVLTTGKVGLDRQNASYRGNIGVVPLIRQGESIGAIEIRTQAGLTERALDTVARLIHHLAVDFEDFWRLESSWLSQETREALRHLTDESDLEKSALADWLLRPDLAYERGAALRRILTDAVSYLAPSEGDTTSRAARRHQILYKTYVEQKNTETIILELGLSRRQYFYDLKEAVEEVAHRLFSVKRAG